MPHVLPACRLQVLLVGALLFVLLPAVYGRREALRSPPPWLLRPAYDWQVGGWKHMCGGAGNRVPTYVYGAPRYMVRLVCTLGGGGAGASCAAQPLVARHRAAVRPPAGHN